VAGKTAGVRRHHSAKKIPHTLIQEV